MGVQLLIRVFPCLSTVLIFPGLCKHVSILIQNRATQHLIFIKTHSRIPGIIDDIPALYHIEIREISDHPYE